MSASNLYVELLRFFRVFISQSQHSFVLSVQRASRQPLERGAKQQKVIPLPHRVMRRARKIDENFLARAQVCIKLAHALLLYLLVMLAAYHENWDLRLGNNVGIPAPSGEQRSTAHAGAPRGSDWIRLDHFRPHTFTCGRIVLILTAHLAIPICSEFVVCLRVHRRAFSWKLRRSA